MALSCLQILFSTKNIALVISLTRNAMVVIMNACDISLIVSKLFTQNYNFVFWEKKLNEKRKGKKFVNWSFRFEAYILKSFRTQQFNFSAYQCSFSNQSHVLIIIVKMRNMRSIVGHECGWKRKAFKQLVFEPEVM